MHLCMLCRSNYYYLFQGRSRGFLLLQQWKNKVSPYCAYWTLRLCICACLLCCLCCAEHSPSQLLLHLPQCPEIADRSTRLLRLLLPAGLWLQRMCSGVHPNITDIVTHRDFLGKKSRDALKNGLVCVRNTLITAAGCLHKSTDSGSGAHEQSSKFKLHEKNSCKAFGGASHPKLLKCGCQGYLGTWIQVLHSLQFKHVLRVRFLDHIKLKV